MSYTEIVEVSPAGEAPSPTQLILTLSDTPLRVIIAACRQIGFPVGDYGQKWGTKDNLLCGVYTAGQADALLAAIGVAPGSSPAPDPAPVPAYRKPAPMPAPDARQQQAETLIAEALRMIASTQTEKPIDHSAVVGIVRNEMSGFSESIKAVIQAKFDGLKPVEIERQIIIDRRTDERRETKLSVDPSLEKPLIACYNAHIPVWLYGRPGTGKTTAARWLAEATGSTIVVFTCSVDTSSGDIIGRSIPSIHDGSSKWVPSPILEAYGSNKKTIILIDEPTNAEAGAIKAINGMVQGDPIDTPAGQVVKGADVYIMLADNTSGTGQTHQSSAAQRQDSSVLNRCRRLAVDYPVKLESTLVPKWVQKVAAEARAVIKDNKLQAEMSLRQMLRMAALEEPLGREQAIKGELVDFGEQWHARIVSAGVGA